MPIIADVAAVTLTRFFTSGVDDFDSLPPSLSALLVLSKLPTFDDDAAVEVYRAICENVNMKAYTQVVRNQVYQLFDSFLASHRNGQSLRIRSLLYADRQLSRTWAPTSSIATPRW